jgi:hypothetical protein
MKKIISVAAALFLFGVSGVYALGLGAQFTETYSAGLRPGLSLLISTSESTHFAVSYDFSDGTRLGVTADYWVLSPTLTRLGPGNLDLFIGIGAYANIKLLFDDFNGGFRVPIGLDYKLSRFDVFFQLAPTFGFQFAPKFALGGNSGFAGSASLGARFWL